MTRAMCPPNPIGEQLSRDLESVTGYHFRDGRLQIRLSHPDGDTGSVGGILPVVVALPVFLYGLFLLRHLQRDYGNWSDVVHASRPRSESP